MEESCLVSLVTQDASQSGVIVHRGWGEEERLNKHRDAGEDAGHTVDTLSAVTETVAEGGAVGNERINTRGIALVLTAL